MVMCMPYYTLYDPDHVLYSRELHIKFLWKGDLDNRSVYDIIFKDSHVKGGARLKIFKNIQNIKFRLLIRNALILSLND